MADLDLVVNTKSVVEALGQVKKLEGQIKALTDRFVRGSTDQKTYAKGLLEIKREYSQLGVSSQKASAQVEKLARGFRSNSTEIERLRSKYNPLYAASRKYELELEEINKAQKLGVLNDRQREASLESLHQEFATGTGRFATYSQQAANGMRGMSVGLQQAGYQMGDFIVQVQSGTNAFVAFGQQATQIVGFLPMMTKSFLGFSGTALMGLTAGLSIAIPLLTAIGAAFMRTRQTSEESADGIETLADRIASAKRQMASFNEEIDRYRSGILDAGEFALVGGIAETEQSIRDIRREIQRLEELGAVTGPNERELQLAEELLANRKEDLENYRQAREEARVLVEAEERRVELQEMLIQREREFHEARLEGLLEAGRLAQQAADERNQIARSLEQEAALYREIAQYGEDSLQVEALRATQAREAHEARIREVTTNEILIRQAMAIYDEMVTAADEAERNANAWERVLGADLSSFNSQVAMLMRLTGMAADEATRYAANMPIGTSSDGERSARGMTISMGGQRTNFDRDLGIGRYAPDTRTGGGGQTQTIQEIIDRRQEQLDLEQELLGLSEERAAARRIEAELEAQYQGEVTETMRDQIEAAAASMAAQEEQIQKLEDIRDRNQDIADTIADSFGDALTSVIDGTKSVGDAFKSMARSIIAELYQIFVVKRITGFISGAIMGAFGGGNKALGGKFASGGMMSPNTPYLVGERGPELVMPNRQSTIMNADLTSKALGGSNGETIVVNQTINVSTGVQQTVRNEIQSLMPQISEAAKIAVVDAKRRGGGYGRAFS